jgi:hypothetical protein
LAVRPDSAGPLGPVQDQGSEASPPSGGGAAAATRQLWARATDTREKRIGLAAAALIVLVGSGIYLATPSGTPQVVVAPVDTATKVSTGETTPQIDSAAIKDSIAYADSLRRADSTAKALAQRARDSLRVAQAAKKKSAPVQGPEVTVPANPQPKSDSMERAAADSLRKAQLEELKSTADEHIKQRIAEFAAAVRSRNQSKLSDLLVESDKTSEARAELLKLVREHDTEATPNGEPQVTLEGRSAVKYQTVTVSWREGTIRRSTKVQIFVLRVESTHRGDGWEDKPLEITKPQRPY